MARDFSRRVVRGAFDGEPDLRTKHWFERPLTRKVKALATLGTAIATIVGWPAATGEWIDHRVGKIVAPIVQESVVGLVQKQQASDAVNARGFAELRDSVTSLTATVRSLAAEVQAIKKHRITRASAHEGTP